jgi:ABC-type phosphate/phosphonate transport system substrate-binding protein
VSFAALPMYDLPELRASTDAWWAGIARHIREAGLGDVPTELERTRTIEAQWRDPALLFGQSCGYPVTHAFAGDLRIVATPCYAVPGCEGGRYYSVLVVHEDAPFRDLAELRGTVVAINEPTSQSGMNALGALVAPLLTSHRDRFFREIVVTGSHASSIAIVRGRRASVASIDCVTHALLARWRPAALVGTRVLTMTASAPALPYVTSRSTDDDRVRRLRTALARAVADPTLTSARNDLFLANVTVLPDSDYDAIVAMQATHRLMG